MAQADMLLFFTTALAEALRRLSEFISLLPSSGAKWTIVSGATHIPQWVYTPRSNLTMSPGLESPPIIVRVISEIKKETNKFVHVT